MTYTPQAGDVIESPNGRKRIRVMAFDNSYEEMNRAASPPQHSALSTLHSRSAPDRLAQRTQSRRERILLARHMVQAMSVALLHPGDILEVFGTLRARHIVAAREVMAMVLHGRGFSYPEIAQAFGKPRTSHVSALEQHRKANDKLECDAFLTGMRQTTMTAAVHDAELAASKIEKWQSGEVAE